MLLETVVAQGTAVPAAWTLAANVGGDSNIIRMFRDPYKAYCIGLHARLQSAAEQIRYRSADWHDNTDGITLAPPAVAAAPVTNLFPTYQRQPLRSQTTVTMEIFGAGVAGNIDSLAMTNFYENTGDLSARLIDEPSLDRLSATGKVQTCQAAIVCGIAGGYSGATLLSAFPVGAPQWKANRDYCLVGYAVDGSVLQIGIRGADTGNVRIGMPGNQFDKAYTANYFVRLSRESGFPCCPVFNTANQTNVTVDVINDENALTVNVDLYFILLDSIVAMQS